MNKLYKNTVSDIYEEAVPQDELELINKHTLVPLAADEVFCFTVTLCDNEIDRDTERFSAAALKAMAPMFIGKTGIADHNMKAENQSCRIYRTWVEESTEKNSSSGESYTELKARVYMPKTPGCEELMAKIKAGINKETSVGCSMGRYTCSICGTDLKKAACKHRKGEMYSGKLCHTVLEEPLDAYEFSFVAVPAQPNAGVTKAFEAADTMLPEEILNKAAGCDCVTLSIDAFSQLTQKISNLELLAQDAKCYRSELEKQVMRLGAMAVPSLATEDFEGICKALTSAQLLSLQKAFEEKAAKLYPLHPQLSPRTEKETNNSEFKI